MLSCGSISSVKAFCSCWWLSRIKHTRPHTDTQTKRLQLLVYVAFSVCLWNSAYNLSALFLSVCSIELEARDIFQCTHAHLRIYAAYWKSAWAKGKCTQNLKSFQKLEKQKLWLKVLCQVNFTKFSLCHLQSVCVCVCMCEHAGKSDKWFLWWIPHTHTTRNSHTQIKLKFAWKYATQIFWATL